MIEKRRPNKTQATEAVAPVVGFLLIVAILFLAAGQYQANVVPQSEREAEISHFREVSDDFVGLRTQIIRSSQTGRLQSQELNTGLRYGTIGVTNAPIGGQFEVNERVTNGEFGKVVIENALNNGEASNFWRGNVDRTYNTSIMNYDIDYNRYTSNSDLYMEHGYVYGDFNRSASDNLNPTQDAGDQVRHIGLTDQPIIQNRTITIYTIMSASDQNITNIQRIGPTTVVANPTSAPMNSISITNNGTDNINITMPSRLNNSTWKQNILEDQMEGAGGTGGTVADVRGINQSHIKIVMKKDITYNLRMARITLDTQTARNRIRTPDEKYVASTNPTINIRESSTVNLEAEARDKFNNGVIGVPVSVEAQESSTTDITGNKCIGDFRGQTAQRAPRCNNDRGTVQPGIDISDSRGRVGYTYESPESDTDRQISFVYRIES